MEYGFIHTTMFFRESEVWNTLRTEVIKRRRHIWNILEIGCSIGLETYSLSYFFHTLQKEYHITAIDKEKRVIEIAKRGKYKYSPSADQISRNTDLLLYDKKENKFLVNEEYKQNISFMPLDISKSEAWNSLRNTYHLIAIRYVLVHIDIQMLSDILKFLHDILTPDGILFVGRAERIERFTSLFERIDRGIYIPR
jgi:chemotaxis methyl-accepting protein methylase